MLSENYKYLMSKYKISHLDWNLSLLHVLNKIEVPPLSVYELSVCNTVSRELGQLRDNLYSCDIYIDTTDINAMLYVLNEPLASFVFIDCIIVWKCMLKCVLNSMIIMVVMVTC